MLIVFSLLLSFLVVLILSPVSFTPKEHFTWEIQQQLKFPPTLLWKSILDVESIPLSKREIVKVDILEKDEFGVAKWKEVTDMKGYSLFERVVVPNVCVTKRMTESSFGMTGQWTYTVMTDQQCCWLTIREESRVDKFPIRLFLSLVGRDRNIKNEFRHIRRLCAGLASSNS